MTANEVAEKILVVNSGSSSLKYSIFDAESAVSAAHGVVERIGAGGTRLVQRGPGGERRCELPHGGHREAFDAMVRELSAPDTGVLRDAAEIRAVGHRVVHGGERFAQAVVVDDDVLRAIEALGPLAPLHNPVNAAGIREARRVFSTVPHVAVFDTAFHQTLPPHAYLYGLPYEFYEQKGVRRYGFHGTSHAYVSLAAAQHLGRPYDALSIVSCHLGNGASLCAVHHGRSIDTSMGMTPGEGLIMGTRCGDIDPGVLLHLERTEGMDAAQLDELLNERSGLLGLSGISSDMREIEAAAEAGNRPRCWRCRRSATACARPSAPTSRRWAPRRSDSRADRLGSAVFARHAGLGCMGIDLDAQRNLEARGFDEICKISTDDSLATVLVVPTDEELMIARETLRAVGRSRS
jgi:acetate kinase